MPAHFDSLGISFQYPDNWTLDDTDALLGRKSVTVFSPGGAFWSVAIHPATADPEKLLATIVDVMRQEYPGLEADAANETMAGYELIGYDLAFYCLDLTNTGYVRRIQSPHATYIIYCQAEDREYALLKRVFQAITVSFLGSLKDLCSLE